MSTEPFDLHAFNTLPRPDIPAALADGTLESLGEVFPYLFKPNRVVAWARDEAARLPLKDGNLRWLFQVPTPPSWQATLLAAVGTDGVFSLWCYRLVDARHPGAGGGLFPLRLSPDSEQTDNGVLLLRLTATRGEGERSTGYYYLQRVLCAMDAEGGVRIRLLTPGGEHHINLDLGNPAPSKAHRTDADPAPPIHFSKRLRPVTDPSLHNLRQIGGWADGPLFYWDTSTDATDRPVLYGSRHDRNRLNLRGYRAGLTLRAAATDGQWVAIGGDDKHLWIGELKTGHLDRGQIKDPLRGHVRSLAMLPRTPSKPPLILIGCDDHFLHILDVDRNLLQKADLGGIPEAILPLRCDSHDGSDWCDLAVLVRDRGLMCLRLLLDSLCLDHATEPLPDSREVVLNSLESKAIANPGLLRNWLHADESETLAAVESGPQLLALALLLHRPRRVWTGLDLSRDLPLKQLPQDVIDYCAHTVKQLIESLASDQRKGNLLKLLRYLRYLDVLLHFAAGPYRARIAVRRLGGWFLTLVERFSKQHRLRDRAGRLIDELPDAKRLLRRHAREVAKCVESRPQSAAAALGSLVALTERLSFSRLFNEIILAPIQTGGRVDAVTIVDTANSTDAQRYGLEVFGRRGEPRLDSFRNDFSTERIRPIETNRPWPSLEQNGSLSDIRALAPLGTDRLLVLTENRVGVIDSPYLAADSAPEFRTLLDTHERTFKELHAAAVSETDGGYDVAIGVEWLPDAGPAVILLQLDRAGNLLREEHLPAPNWSRRVRINALAWDGPQRLWAATGGPGYLLKWERHSNPSWTVDDLLAVGSPQHALRVVGDEQVLLGGASGVVRSFHAAGSLQWTRILPGTIVGISTWEPVLTPEQRFAPVCVITESGVVALYDLHGRHLGILQLPRDHLTALCSGTVAPAKVQHHLLGTLRGEVRLLEEVPDALARVPLNYIRAQPGESDREQSWAAVRTVVEQQVRELERNAEQCRRWTDYAAATEEPFRACWAARCLLRKHGDFESALQLLTHFTPAKDIPDQELSAHVFGALGRYLAGLPETCEDRFIDLCRKTWDGALASLINHAGADPGRAGLWRRILDVAREKILHGQPFVSSAILQRIQRHESKCASALEWVELMLREAAAGNRGIHPGFAQGLLGLVLERIGYGENGVLDAFARPAAPGAALVTALRANTQGQAALFEILDRYSEILLRPLDHRAWRALSSVLQGDRTALYEQLRSALNNAPECCASAPDVETLSRHLALFPRGTPDEQAHWRADALTELRKLTDDVRSALHRIHSLGMSVRDSLVRLEELDVWVSRATSPSPLAVNLHAAWQNQWAEEIQHERDRLTRLQDEEEAWPTAPEPVAQVFRVMHERGFRRGRFYRIHHLPGCGTEAFRDCLGLLELRNHTGGPILDPDRPERHEITGVLAGRISEYAQSEKPGADTLVCKQRPADPTDPEDPGLRYWQAVWGETEPAPMFEIPVLRQRGLTFRAEGLFVFDLPPRGSQDTAEFAASTILTTLTIRDALRPALRRVIDENLVVEERQYAERASELLDALKRKMPTPYGQDAIQLALLRAAVDVTGAEDGLLVVRSSVNGLFSVRGLTDEVQEVFRGVHLRPEDHMIPAVRVMLTGESLLVPSFSDYPDAENVRQQLAARFAAAGKAGKEQDWLGKFASALVLPVKVDGEPMCAFSLRCSRRFAFFEHHLTAVETLLRRYSDSFTVLKMLDERRHFINALVHDVRSDLLLIKQPLERLRRHPEERDRLLDFAFQYVHRLYDRSQNVLDTGRSPGAGIARGSFRGAGAIVSEILRLQVATTEPFHPEFEVQPNEFNVSAWDLELRGSRGDFERVVRNLIDNAVKYGHGQIRIAASVGSRHWHLLISNPGWMTPEEDRLKFRPFSKPVVPRFDGSHVGLAASLGLATAIGGNLELENDETNTSEPRVVATLTWPLHLADATTNPE